MLHQALRKWRGGQGEDSDVDLHLDNGENDLNTVLLILLLLSPHRQMMVVQAAAIDNGIPAAM